MRRINTLNKDVDAFGAGKHGWKNGVPGTANRPTEGQAEWFNAMQEEIAAVIEGEGTALADADNGQLRKAIDKMVDRKLVRLRKFGPLASDGVTDDIATWQAAAASTARFIDARGENCRLVGTINGRSDQVWLLDGTTLHVEGDNSTLFNFDQKADFALIGQFTILGDGTTVGTSRAISIKDCKRFKIDRPVIRQVRGHGLYLEPGASTTDRGDHGVIIDPRIDQCYIGYQDDAGTGIEYCQISNIHVTRCTSVGVVTCAGNMGWSGGSIVDNANGVMVTGGPNSAHGMFVGVNINHNAGFNILLQDVANGESFTGCHCYGDGVNAGIIHLVRSQGFTFVGGHLNATVTCDDAIGYSLIADNFVTAEGSPFVHNGTTPKKVTYRGNYTPAGAWSLNDWGGDLFVYAVRSGASQAIAAYPANTVLIHDTENYDSRDAYNPATGTFTAPWAGEFEVSASLKFGGAGMVHGHVTVLRNGGPVGFSPVVALSATLAVCNLKLNVFLVAGDVLTIQYGADAAGAAGVTLDSTGSNFTIRGV